MSILNDDGFLNLSMYSVEKDLDLSAAAVLSSSSSLSSPAEEDEETRVIATSTTADKQSPLLFALPEKISTRIVATSVIAPKLATVVSSAMTVALPTPPSTVPSFPSSSTFSFSSADIRNKKRKKNAPIRARSAFIYFSKDIRHSVVQENPSLRFGEISKLVGKKFRSLTYDEKLPYLLQEEQDRERYYQEINQYNGKKRRELSSSTTTTITTSTSTPALLTVLKEHGSVVRMILSCLGPKSLVRFVSSCKTLLNDNRMLPEEVSRRKACVAWGKEQLLILHQRTMVFPAPRADVLLAFQVYSLCRRIIDDKIDYLVDAPENFRDELFAHERSELAVPTGPPHSHPNFYMLPLAFYIRPHGDLQWPIHASATFTDARSLIDRILQRYSQQMDSFYSWLDSSSETKGYNHSNYPFRKFDHPLCTTYLEESLLYVRDRIVVDQELNDAFRILAFTAAIRYPYIRDSLHFVLHHSDALAFNTILQQPTFVSLESSQLVYKFNRFQEWNVVPSPSATSIASAAV